MEYEDLEELQDWCDCSSDSYTDMISMLIQLSSMSGLSDDLEAVLERDLQSYLLDFRENYEIVEDSYTMTHRTRELVRKS